jgi:hypothetical protein
MFMCVSVCVCGGGWGLEKEGVVWKAEMMLMRVVAGLEVSAASLWLDVLIVGASFSFADT